MKKKLLMFGMTLMLLVALGVLAVACGGTTSGNGSSDDGTPVKGGTLTVLTSDEGAGVIGIPWKMQGNQAITETASVDTLVHVAWDGTVEPNLAKSWEIAADDKSITFELQPDVKFTDGTACDATAIKWNLDQWIAGGVGMTHAWDSVEVVDSTHIKINLKGWQNSVLTAFAEAYLGFISPTAYEQNGETWAEGNIVSTGPYKLTSITPSVGWTLEPNADWWGGATYLDTIEFKVVKDPNSMQMMLESGAADVACIQGGNPTVQNALKDKGFVLLGYGVEEPTCLYVDGVNADSPWGKKEVREAVDYALDRESMAALGKGLFMPTYQFVDPRSELYDASLERKYDKAKAMELLTAAGYPDGFETTIYTDFNQDLAAVVQQNLADVGITAKVEIIDTGALFGMSMNGWQNSALTAPFPSKPGYMDGVAAWFTDGLFVSSYRSTELQDIVNGGYAAKTAADMAPFNKQAVALLSADVAGYPLYVNEYSIGVKAAYVHSDGWGEGPTGYWTPASCWIDK